VKPINEELSAFWTALSPDSGLVVNHVGCDLIEFLQDASDGVGEVLCDVLVNETPVAWGSLRPESPQGTAPTRKYHRCGDPSP
jgi:hypothetical protein